MRPSTPDPRALPQPPRAFRPPAALARAAAFAALAVAAWLAAAPEGVAQSFKVGVFDKQRIVDESRLGVTAREKFEKQQQEAEERVATKQQEFEALQQSFNQKAQVLSEEKRLELQRQVARARDEWQASGQNAERDLQRAYNTALVDIVSKIDPVIEEFGRTEGYDLMFDRMQCAFAGPKLEVTDALIAKVNAKYPQTGASGR